MANVSVTNTDADLSGHTLAVCETAKTITGVWTFTGVPVFTNGFTTSAAVTFAGVQNVLPNAAVSAPALVFANSATTGLYSVAAGEVDIALGGVQSFKLEGTNGLTLFGVNLINASGKIIAINSTYFASLDGSTLTALNASALSSGTVATARLGSGSATASTFLRGDGTWATPSSATVALYTCTLTNVVNTGSETDVLHFTIPAGAMADGDVIEVFVSSLEKNNTGGSVVTAAKVNVGAGAQVSIGGFSQADDPGEVIAARKFFLQRKGSVVIVGNTPLGFSNASTASGTSTPADFTSSNVVTLKLTLASADATYYYKPQSASAIHYKN